MARKITVHIDNAETEKQFDDLITYLHSIPKIRRLPLALLIERAIRKLTKKDVESLWETELKGEDLFWYHLFKNGHDESSKDQFFEKLIEQYRSQPPSKPETPAKPPATHS